MGNQRSLPLPLRTIVVSTRAAVKRNRDAGNEMLVRASVERGLSLLDQLQAALAPDAPGDTVEMHEAARRDLRSLMESSKKAPVSCRE